LKLWPARTKAQAPKDVPVTDLDAIVAEPVYFKYHGKIHRVEPVTFEDFLKFTNAQSELFSSNRNNEKMTPEQLVARYYSVISSLCKTVSLEDIRSMEQVQIAALYQLIMDMVTGQVKLEDGKKKTRQKIQLYESVERSSLPNAPESSDGQSKQH
jgi:hypothetical protein